MLSFLRPDPIKRLIKQRNRLLEEAMHIQRSGDLKLYAEKVVTIDKLEKEIERLESSKR